MDFTHKLPAHLGGWPCRLLRPEVTSAATNEPAPMLTLVEYYVAGAEEHYARRIFVDPGELERIVPAEPTAPYVVGADGHVYRMLPGREPGTDERLWQKAHGGPVFTWAQLTEEWFDAQKTQPVVPLAPAQDVPLPFSLTNADRDRVGVQADDRKVCLELADNWSWSDPDEAEQIAWALLSAVRQVRSGWVKGHTPVTVGNLTDSPQLPVPLRQLCAGCEAQAVCIADQKCVLGRF